MKRGKRGKEGGGERERESVCARETARAFN